MDLTCRKEPKVIQATQVMERFNMNESLMSTVKELLRLAKVKKGDLDFKFVWTRNGIIHMRKDETAQIFKINFAGDFDKLT